MTEWLPGNYEIALKKKKSQQGSYATYCLHKQVIKKKNPLGTQEPTNSSKCKEYV